MARSGITKEQVFETAAALAEEGTRPTVNNIRERLGSGSYSTITAHLAAWREDSAAVVAPAPSDIPEAVQSSFGRVWALANKAARDELETQREAFENLRREMDTERGELLAEIARLEAG